MFDRKMRVVLSASRLDLGAVVLLGTVLALGSRVAGNEGKVTFYGAAQDSGKIGATIHYVKSDGTKDSCKVMGTWTHNKGTTPDVKAKQLAQDIKNQCVGVSASADFSTVTVESDPGNTITEIDIDDDTDQEITINPQSLDDGVKSCSVRLNGAATGGVVLLRLDGCGTEATVPAAGKTGAQIAAELASLIVPCDPRVTVLSLDLGGGAGEIHLIGLSNANSTVTFWAGGAFGLDCTVAMRSLGARRSAFLRGDSNDDGTVDISDGVFTLGFLFLGSADSGCPDAMDSNDDGEIDISDPVFTLVALFLGGVTIPPPHPACGADPTEDPMGCDRRLACPSCLSPADLRLLSQTSIDPYLCLPSEVGRAAVGALEVVVCPAVGAVPCDWAAGPGCGLTVPLAAGTFDLAGSRILVHIEGLAEALPVAIRDMGLPTETLCQVDIPRLWTDVVFPLALEATADGEYRIADVLMPFIEFIDLEATTVGEPACSVLASPGSILGEALRPALHTALFPELLEMRARLIGVTLCMH